MDSIMNFGVSLSLVTITGIVWLLIHWGEVKENMRNTSDKMHTLEDNQHKIEAKVDSIASKQYEGDTRLAVVEKEVSIISETVKRIDRHLSKTV